MRFYALALLGLWMVAPMATRADTGFELMHQKFQSNRQSRPASAQDLEIGRQWDCIEFGSGPALNNHQPNAFQFTAVTRNAHGNEIITGTTTDALGYRNALEFQRVSTDVGEGLGSLGSIDLPIFLVRVDRRSTDLVVLKAWGSITGEISPTSYYLCSRDRTASSH